MQLLFIIFIYSVHIEYMKWFNDIKIFLFSGPHQFCTLI